MKDIFITYDKAQGAFKDVFERYRDEYGLDPKKHYIRVVVDDDDKIVDAEFGRDPGAVKTATTEAALGVIPGLAATGAALAIPGAGWLAGLLQLITGITTAIGTRYAEQKILEEIAPDIAKSSYVGSRLHPTASVLGESISIAPAQKFLPLGQLARAISSGQNVPRALGEVAPPLLLGGGISAGMEYGQSKALGETPTLDQLATAFLAGGAFGGGAPRGFYRNLPGYKTFVPSFEGEPFIRGVTPTKDVTPTEGASPEVSLPVPAKEGLPLEAVLSPKQPSAEVKPSVAETEPVVPKQEKAPLTGEELKVTNAEILRRDISNISKVIDNIKNVPREDTLKTKVDLIEKAIEEGRPLSPSEIALAAAYRAVERGNGDSKLEKQTFEQELIRIGEEVHGTPPLLYSGMDPRAILKYAGEVKVNLPEKVKNALGEKLANYASVDPGTVLRIYNLVEDSKVGEILKAAFPKMAKEDIAAALYENPGRVVDMLGREKIQDDIARALKYYDKVHPAYKGQVNTLKELERVEKADARLKIIAEQLKINKLPEALALAEHPEFDELINNLTKDPGALARVKEIAPSFNPVKAGIVTPDGYPVANLAEVNNKVGTDVIELLENGKATRAVIKNILKRAFDGDPEIIEQLKALHELSVLTNSIKENSVELLQKGGGLYKKLGPLVSLEQARNFERDSVRKITKDIDDALSRTNILASGPYGDRIDRMVRALAEFYDGDFAKIKKEGLHDKIVDFYAKNSYILPFDKNIKEYANRSENDINKALKKETPTTEEVPKGIKEETPKTAKEETKTEEKAAKTQEAQVAKEETTTKEETPKAAKEETSKKAKETTTAKEEPLKAAKEEEAIAKTTEGETETKEEAPKSVKRKGVGKGGVQAEQAKKALEDAYKELPKDIRNNIDEGELENLRANLGGNSKIAIKLLKAIQALKESGTFDKVLQDNLKDLPPGMRKYVDALLQIRPEKVEKKLSSAESKSLNARITEELENRNIELDKASRELLSNVLKKYNLTKDDKALGLILDKIKDNHEKAEELLSGLHRMDPYVIYTISDELRNLLGEDAQELYNRLSAMLDDVKSPSEDLVRAAALIETERGKELFKTYAKEKSTESLKKLLSYLISMDDNIKAVIAIVRADNFEALKLIDNNEVLADSILEVFASLKPTFKPLEKFIDFLRDYKSKDDKWLPAVRGLATFVSEKVEVPNELKQKFMDFANKSPAEAKKIAKKFKSLGEALETICINI